jgi:hypothetical protein
VFSFVINAVNRPWSHLDSLWGIAVSYAALVKLTRESSYLKQFASSLTLSWMRQVLLYNRMSIANPVSSGRHLASEEVICE